MIYFDNAATTYPKPECVYTAMDHAQRHLSFNSGRGQYEQANKAHSIIEETRSMLSKSANAESLVFTSSATHALNMIVSGIDFKTGDVVLVSPYEHNAVVRTLHVYSKKIGFNIEQIPLKEDCSIDIEKLEFQCIMNNPKAIFCSHVSNVTGYILPIHEIGGISNKYNSIFVVDGAQAFGILDVDIKKDFIDYYVFAGHKTLYGPFGIAGFLYQKNNLSLSFYGGTGTDSLNVDMPSIGNIRFEPSSPNVVGIFGLKEGFQWTKDNNIKEHEIELINYLRDKLKKIDGVKVYGGMLPSLGILSFNLDGYNSEDLAKVLSDDFDICVRGGYHCCPYVHDYIKSKESLGTVRISVSYFNTKEEVDKLLEAIEELSVE